MRAIRLVKKDLDSKDKDLLAVNRLIAKMDEDLILNNNRKNFSVVTRLEDQRVQQIVKRSAILREMEVLRAEAYGSWAPRSTEADAKDSTQNVE